MFCLLLCCLKFDTYLLYHYGTTTQLTQPEQKERQKEIDTIMSFLIPSLRASTTATATATAGSRIASRSTITSIKPITATTAASFHSSPNKSTLKETDRNRDGDVNSYYDAEKNDQLKATHEHKAEWKQELASDSESAVKADRGDVEHQSESFSEMQRETENLPNRKGPVNKTQ